MSLLRSLHCTLLTGMILLGTAMTAIAADSPTTSDNKSANKKEGVFSVYMLDPGGHFMEELKKQVDLMEPLSYKVKTVEELELMGHIDLRYMGPITDDVDFYTISRPIARNSRIDMDSSETYELLMLRTQQNLPCLVHEQRVV